MHSIEFSAIVNGLVLKFYLGKAFSVKAAKSFVFYTAKMIALGVVFKKAIYGVTQAFEQFQNGPCKRVDIVEDVDDES